MSQSLAEISADDESAPPSSDSKLDDKSSCYVTMLKTIADV